MATEVDERASYFSDVEDDEEEALSLSDFPVFSKMEDGDAIPRGPDASDPPAGDDFEFKAFNPGGVGYPTSKLDETHMCAAEDVFFQGQILPLRPSISSDCGSALLGQLSRGPSRCGSSSSSSSSTAVLDRNSSGSSGSMSRSSSSSISRSQSTHSSASFCSSNGGDTSGRHSISSNFYAHPSPKPHLPTKATGGSRRRSTSSAPPPGWGLFRLGLVRGPEIELLQDARRSQHHRRSSFASSTGSVGASRRSLDGERSSTGSTGSEPKTTASAGRSRGDNSTSSSDSKGLWMFILQNGLSCKCSSGDVLEPIKSPLLSKEAKQPGSVSLSTKDEEMARSTSRRHQRAEEGRCRSSRTFQWLERELPISKAAAA